MADPRFLHYRTPLDGLEHMVHIDTLVSIEPSGTKTVITYTDADMERKRVTIEASFSSVQNALISRNLIVSVMREH